MAHGAGFLDVQPLPEAGPVEEMVAMCDDGRAHLLPKKGKPINNHGKGTKQDLYLHHSFSQRES